MPASIPAEDLLAALQSQATVGIALVDEELRYVSVNVALARMNGCTPEEHHGRSIREVLPDAADLLEPFVRRALAGEAVVDLDLLAPDGRRFVVTYVPVGEPPAAVAAGLVVETTAGRQAQEEARLAQHRLALALAGTETGTFEWHAHTGELRWSATMGPLWGRPRGWQPGGYEEYLATVHPDDREALAAAVRRARTEGHGYGREFRCLWPDGAERWVLSRVHVICEGGRPAVLVGLVMDVDERRRRELAADYLARASLALADTLDVRATLQHVAELALPELADWCAVHLASGPEGPERVAVAASDARRAELARRLNERYPQPPDAPMGAPAVMRTGRSELYPEIADELLRAAAVDGEHHDLLRRLGLRSAMVVPMTARGATVGAISFASGRPGRVYGTADVALAEELGRRAGLAVDNAKAHAAQRRAGERLRQLQAITDVALSHLDLEALLDELLGRLRDVVGARSAAVLLLDPDRGHLAVRAVQGPDVPVVPAAFADPGAHFGQRREADRETVGVPLRAPGGVIGVLQVTAPAERGFRREDLDLLERAADRAAVAIDHARLYERMRDTAVTLQRSLLPTALPDVPGLEVAVRYVAGAAGTEVGGDWYDVFPLRDGRVAIVVGDVAGRGVHAAAGMGQLRSALRAYAVDREDPAAALAGLDAFMTGVGGVSFATVAMVALDPATGDATLGLAGHPPPVLRRGLTAEVLEAATDPPVGAGPVARTSRPVRLESGDGLLLYTDGLVERRDRNIDERIAELARHAAALPAGPDELADGVLERMLAGDPSRDDVAVVALRRGR